MRKIPLYRSNAEGISDLDTDYIYILLFHMYMFYLDIYIQIINVYCGELDNYKACANSVRTDSNLRSC